jgi:MFS family permease
VAAEYRAVLARPGAARLIGTGLVGRMPQGMSSLATLLLVRHATGSYAAAGAAVGAGALAAAICGPLLGRLVDRVGRRLVVGPAALLEACAFVALALAAGAHLGVAVLIACAALVGATVPPIAPVVRALFGELYERQEVRETAYAIEAISQETIWIVGPLAATLAVTLVSAEFAVAMLAAVVLAGSLLFMTSPLLGVGEHGGPQAHEGGSALASLDLRWLLMPVTLMGVALGGVEVGIPSLALHEHSRAATGFLLALWSLGSMLGGITYSRGRSGAPLGSRYATLLALNCVSIVPLVLAGSLVAAAPASLIAGLAIAPALSCMNSLVGHVVIRGSEHEAFGWTLSGLVAGVAAGSALAGALIAPVGVHAPFELALAAAGLAALGALRFRGRFSAELAQTV